MLRGLEELKSLGMQDCFKLLHFHLGSQIPNIRIVQAALNEAARVYTELSKAGAGLEYLDVGGGLGVDYDGSQTNFESSVNYTLEEYANDVVYHIQTVCDDAGVKHPTIVSESGRAIVAYHSVLIFNVLGVSAFGEEKIPESIKPEEAEQPDERDLHGVQTPCAGFPPLPEQRLVEGETEVGVGRRICREHAHVRPFAEAPSESTWIRRARR